MGGGQSTPAIVQCLQDICGDRENCVAGSGNGWARPYNLDVPVKPAAVIKPLSAEDVADAIKCATDHGLTVQALSGGHSYG